METRLMKETKTILALLAILGLFAMMTATTTTVSADGIPVPATPTGGGGSGSGGGGSTEPEPELEIPHYFREARIRQELNIISGIEITASAENRPEQTWTWVDDKGVIHTDVEEKSCYGSLWFNIEQGAQDTDYLPLSPSLEVERRDDKGRFQIEARFPFIFRQDADDWTTPPAGNMSWEDPFDTGLRFDTHISLEHQREWHWPDGYEGEPVITLLPDINGNVDFWFHLAEIKNVRLRVEDYTWTIWHGDGLFEVFEGMQIRADFDLEWTGDDVGLVALNSAFPLAVPTPEPATMLLLALGGLAMLRRRRR